MKLSSTILGISQKKQLKRVGQIIIVPDDKNRLKNRPKIQNIGKA